MRILTLFLSLLFTFEASALTFKTNSGGGYRMDNEVKELITDLVLQKRDAQSLSDEELCLSLTELDMPSTFYEHQKRGLDCLGISQPQEEWTQPTRDEAFLHLRQYQKKYGVEVPAFDLAKATPVYADLAATLDTYEMLNPSFRTMMGFVEPDSNRQFCLDWLGNVNYIAENQSKNLDGSISWSDDTLRDGFVLCQDALTQLTLIAMYDQSIRDQIERILKQWIDNDALRRDMLIEGDRFAHINGFNHALIALEMLHSSFGWDDAQNKKLNEWMVRRALEMFPSDVNPISKRCPTNHKSRDFYSYEACQNGGILRAQALMRVAIWVDDPELAAMSYVAFHRYMTGHRKDGSNITDSRRGCVAADYNIWASQFLSDYLFQWGRVGPSLWEDESHEGVTPNDAVEYSLSLFGDFEAINKYTVKRSWRGCGDNSKTRTQEASNLPPNSKFVKASFAPYFANRGEFGSMMAVFNRADRYSYSSQSGANYEVALLLTQPETWQRVARDLPLNRHKILEESDPALFSGTGLTRNARGYLTPLNPDSFKLARYKLREPSALVGQSTRYRVRVGEAGHGDVMLRDTNLTFFVGSGHIAVMVNLGKIVAKYPDIGDDWSQAVEACGTTADDDLTIEFPIITDWRELEENLGCYLQNAKGDKFRSMLLSLVHIGSTIDLAKL